MLEKSFLVIIFSFCDSWL